MSNENHINFFKQLLDYLPNVECARHYPNFKTEKNLGMKRKAPDQCDQSKSVTNFTKVRKPENKPRDKWFYFFLITNYLACNSITRI